MVPPALFVLHYDKNIWHTFYIAHGHANWSVISCLMHSPAFWRAILDYLALLSAVSLRQLKGLWLWQLAEQVDALASAHLHYAADISGNERLLVLYLVLLPGLDGVNDSLPIKANLDDFIDHVIVNDGVAGHGVGLNDCQVAGQVLAEPGVLPANHNSISACCL